MKKVHFYRRILRQLEINYKENPYNRTTTIQPVICQSYKNGHFVNAAKSET